MLFHLHFSPVILKFLFCFPLLEFFHSNAASVWKTSEFLNNVLLTSSTMQNQKHPYTCFDVERNRLNPPSTWKHKTITHYNFLFYFQKQMDLLKVPITDPVCPGLVLLYIPSSAVTQSLYFECLWSSAARPRDSRAPALWSSSVGSVCSSLSALPPFSRHLSHASPSARQAEHLSCTCVRASKQHIWHNVLLRMTVGWRNWE